MRKSSPSKSNASHLRQVPSTIWMLGFTSLFADVSTEIVQSVLPVFLVSSLGVNLVTVGLIDGLGEAIASIGKIFSGAISDYIGHRKWLAVSGYGLSAIARPMYPLANSVIGVLMAKLLDKSGKGIRVAPRDALVADCVLPQIRGTAYGLRQGLDTIGAIIGPLIAATVLNSISGSFHVVFWISCIPAAISVLVLALGVKEPNISHAGQRRKFPLGFAELKRLGISFWSLMLVIVMLLLMRFSESFMLLRGENLGLSVASVPLLLAAMNLVAASVSLPFGRLSDRIGRRGLIAAGFGVLVVSHIVFMLAVAPQMVFVGAALWGLHLGITQGVLTALITDVVPSDLRGTAFGAFHLISGLTILVGSLIAGWLWDSFGAPAPFALAACSGVIGIAAFQFLPSSQSSGAV